MVTPVLENVPRVDVETFATVDKHNGVSTRQEVAFSTSIVIDLSDPITTAVVAVHIEMFSRRSDLNKNDGGLQRKEYHNGSPYVS